MDTIQRIENFINGELQVIAQLDNEARIEEQYQLFLEDEEAMYEELYHRYINDIADDGFWYWEL